MKIHTYARIWLFVLILSTIVTMAYTGSVLVVAFFHALSGFIAFMVFCKNFRIRARRIRKCDSAAISLAFVFVVLGFASLMALSEKEPSG